MEYDRLKELHNIAHLDNLQSILRYGILSFNKAKRLAPTSIALQDTQDLREKKRVPRGLPLHDYANLYICARNPMLYKRLNIRDEIAVLKIDKEVLNIEGVVVTDQNAASEYVLFSKAPEGLGHVNEKRTFADNWTDHEDRRDYWRHKSQKCAEVLVPHQVDPQFIVGIYVCSAGVADRISGINISVEINPYLFFS